MKAFRLPKPPCPLWRVWCPGKNKGQMDRTKQNKSVIPGGRAWGALLLGRRVGPPSVAVAGEGGCSHPTAPVALTVCRSRRQMWWLWPCASRYRRCLDNRHCLCPKEDEEKDDFCTRPQRINICEQINLVCLGKVRRFPGHWKMLGAARNTGFFFFPTPSTLI